MPFFRFFVAPSGLSHGHHGAAWAELERWEPKLEVSLGGLHFAGILLSCFHAKTAYHPKKEDSPNILGISIEAFIAKLSSLELQTSTSSAGQLRV